MDKQKKNKVLRVASLALVLTLITTCLSAYTLAKYTTSVSGTDTARVAKLDFGAELEVMDANGTTQSKATLTATPVALDIFSTSYDSIDPSLTAPVSETTVKSVADPVDKIIAPGVKGDFEITFAGQSEVSLRISLGITETNTAKVPMLYYYNTKYYSNQYAPGVHYFVLNNDGSTITTVNVEGDLTALATATAADIGIVDAGTDLSTATATKTYAVNWWWPFEEWTGDSTNANRTLITGTGIGTDAYDTALGLKGTDTVTLKIAATATQVD